MFFLKKNKTTTHGNSGRRSSSQKFFPANFLTPQVERRCGKKWHPKTWENVVKGTGKPVCWSLPPRLPIYNGPYIDLPKGCQMVAKGCQLTSLLEFNWHPDWKVLLVSGPPQPTNTINNQPRLKNMLGFNHLNTSRKVNVEPENKFLEKESPVGNLYFKVPC